MTTKPIPDGVPIEGAITKFMDRRFLSSIDLAGQGDVSLTIDRVTYHKELKYQNGQKAENAKVMHFREINRPLVLNVTNIKMMVRLTGSNDVKAWKGAKVKLRAVPGRYFGEEGLAARVVGIDTQKGTR